MKLGKFMFIWFAFVAGLLALIGFGTCLAYERVVEDFGPQQQQQVGETE